MTKLLKSLAFNCSSDRKLKHLSVGTVSAVALALVAQIANAQDATGVTEEVHVTGTRIVRDGYSAPTPVTVVGTEEFQAAAPANLQDFVNQLPAVVGSSQTSSGAASISAGGSGISALNLRALGISRTLVLLNGHRSAGSLATGDVDINTFPQQLVNRIDVVTGGASADYGSDAVGGVVNFLLDTKFTGIKTDLEYGETTYGEQPNYKGQLTYGTDFDGGRGHFIASGELFTSQRIVGVPRSWNDSHFFTSQTASGGTNGDPWYFSSTGTTPSQTAPGGLIVSGALKGTYFGLNGSVNQLAYGTVNGQWMVGGEGNVTCAHYCSGTDLAAAELRQSAYTRLSYNLTPEIELYAEASYAKDNTKAVYEVGWVNLGGVTIQADNAFVPASVKTLLTANKLTSFTIGTTNQGLPSAASNDTRSVQRYLVGMDGNFSFFGDWKYDLYGQTSLSNVRELALGDWQTQRMALAQDAVAVTAANVGKSGLAIGSITCRSTLTAPANGCMPLSRIGINGGLQTAAAYQAGANYVEYANPYRDEFIRETDFGFNISGNPFDDWAGPVSVALGGEWRLESVNGSVLPEYTTNWNFGNYLVNVGHYSVAEGYVETVVPLMAGMDVNGAVRYTAYSTSGGVNTWKVGWNYAPTDDIRLRATYSHDIRAPNLAELFAAGTARSNSVLINNTAYAFVQNQTGNPDVTPEAANSLGVGTVLTPRFIPGLAVSADYYNISVKHQIGVISAQNVANLCYVNNIQSYCNNIHSTGSLAAGNLVLSKIDLKPINFASVKAEGIDFDVTYGVPLDEITIFGNIPGDLRLHALATHYMRMYTNDGFSPTTDTAGTNVSGGLPDLLYRLEASYKVDPWGINLIGRGLTPGKIANEYTVCTSACPISTPQNRTTNFNHIDGAFYLDATVNYSFEAYGADALVFFTVKNMFNAPPGLIPTGGGSSSSSTAAYPSTNGGLYDMLGRVFRVGFRANL